LLLTNDYKYRTSYLLILYQKLALSFYDH